MRNQIGTVFKNVRDSFYLKRSAPVLLYHHVGEDRRPEGVGGKSKLHIVSQSDLKQQLVSLGKSFDFLFIDDFFERIERGQSLKGYACLTFDDGATSVVEQALPVLEELKIPATIFVNKSLVEGAFFWRDLVRWIVDQKQVDGFIRFTEGKGIDQELVRSTFQSGAKSHLSQEDIKRLPALLNEFFRSVENFEPSHTYLSKEQILANLHPLLRWGNHTSNHLVLSHLEESDQLREIEGTKTFLESFLAEDQISRVFAVPFGGSWTFNDITIRLVEQLGYRGLVSTDQLHYRSNRQTSDGICHRVNNIIIYDRFLPRAFHRFF